MDDVFTLFITTLAMWYRFVAIFKYVFSRLFRETPFTILRLRHLAILCHSLLRPPIDLVAQCRYVCVRGQWRNAAVVISFYLLYRLSLHRAPWCVAVWCMLECCIEFWVFPLRTSTCRDNYSLSVCLLRLVSVCLTECCRELADCRYRHVLLSVLRVKITLLICGNVSSWVSE